MGCFNNFLFVLGIGLSTLYLYNCTQLWLDLAKASPSRDGNGTTSQANNERVGIEKEEAGQLQVLLVV